MGTKMDEDVKLMNLAQARREIMRLRRAFEKELNHTGNHRCFINLMEAVYNKKIKPIDIPEDKFIANCRKYYTRNTKGKK